LHHTTQLCMVLDSFSQLSFSCYDRLSNITTVGPSVSPQKSRSPRPADRKKGGADIAASPSILVALLICCSARNTAHVSDLYPASSNSSVRFVSFRIVVISACSWPSQHFCFFRKFHPPLVMVRVQACSQTFHRDDSCFVHPLFAYLRRVLDSDETNCWNLLVRNQFFPITSGVSCSQRSPGSCADIGIEGASHRMLLHMNSEPFL